MMKEAIAPEYRSIICISNDVITFSLISYTFLNANFVKSLNSWELEGSKVGM
jgi:hypothetical protein